MTGAELRVVDGKNIFDLNDDELKRTRDALQKAGLQVVSIASPVLKCVFRMRPKWTAGFSMTCSHRNIRSKISRA